MVISVNGVGVSIRSRFLAVVNSCARIMHGLDPIMRAYKSVFAGYKYPARSSDTVRPGSFTKC